MIKQAKKGSTITSRKTTATSLSVFVLSLVLFHYFAFLSVFHGRLSINLFHFIYVCETEKGGKGICVLLQPSTNNVQKECEEGPFTKTSLWFRIDL